MMNPSIETKHWGGHSMVAPLRRVLVFPPVQPNKPVDWQAFGYRRPIIHKQALEEHRAFVDLLTSDGIEVALGEIDDPTLQDAIFPFDPSFIVDSGAILCSMGKPLRAAEVELAERTMTELGIPIAGRIELPGLVEGGDCLWIDANTMAIGRGFRTNQAGIDQMRELLAPLGVAVIEVGLPYLDGPAECLHLLSLISMIDDDLAVVYRPLLEVAFVQELEGRGITLVDVPENEFATQGPNVLVTAPRRCIMLRENPVTAERLRAHGCEVRTYVGGEISHNRAGGPTCLTRPLLREA